ncbi:MAG: GNAT family N-acetyltransferase [Bdellovibrio sp.]|nr:GNAT family N-acetyltransferase [Bdellovibrio sp.]
MLLDSPLESQRFNIKAGKLKISTKNELKVDLAAAKEKGFNFLSCRIPTQEVFLFQDLESAGFFLTDTLVYYKKTVPDEKLTQAWESCLGNNQHIEKVVAVAREAFQGYPSHYSMDLKLNQDSAGEVYQDWAHRSCRDKTIATDVLATFEGGQLVAFVSVKDQMSHGEVLLAAVHPAYQGQGLLQKLLQAGLAWAQTQGHKEMFYSTQLQNIAAQKALVRQGWELSHSFYTLHCWL